LMREERLVDLYRKWSPVRISIYPETQNPRPKSQDPRPTT
jgi:hypothetical protein